MIAKALRQPRVRYAVWITLLFTLAGAGVLYALPDYETHIAYRDENFTLVGEWFRFCDGERYSWGSQTAVWEIVERRQCSSGMLVMRECYYSGSLVSCPNF